jgi:eukaryotic-like serine/threonine-protein kinase
MAAEVWASQQPELAIGSRVGAYKLTALIGQGGMGAVYRATREDDEFQKQVAIKLVKYGMGTEAILNRFRNERQILATLEHPGIARLLDGGTSNGLPFFVMECVEGKPITVFCDERALSPRERVRLFLQVCDAVQYAHRNLVVHRDLKPSNILVTEQGSVKLLDFGIAKVLTPQATGEQTQTVGGLRMFTPDYASPEQVRGQPVGTTADVYSLGAVLYELLSGQRPHRLTTYTPVELVEAICQRDPVKLSLVVPPSLRSAVSGDLETILAKAMEKDPARRYRSVDLLRLDLENYIEGRPVSARPPALLYLAGKFVRRHSVSVAVGVLSAIALIATAAFALDQARQSRDRFNQVRRIARTMLFDFHDEIDRVPGNTKAKMLLVSTAREYLDNLAGSAGEDRTLLEELAEAYERLAAAQGGSSQINLGDRPGALESRRKALELRQKLAGSNIASDRKMVDNASRVSNDLRDLGRLTEAVQAGQVAVTLATRYLPKVKENREQHCIAHSFLARALQDAGQVTEALLEYERAERELLAWSDPPDRSFLSTQQDRADLLHTLGRVEEAIALLQRLDQQTQALVDSAGEGRQKVIWRRMNNITRLMLAEMHYDPFTPGVNQPEPALRYREQVRQSWEQFLAVDPNDNTARLNLAICDSETALTLLRMDPAEALRRASRATVVFEQLEKATPTSSHVVFRSARAQARLGVVLTANGRAAEARRLLEASLEKQRQLADAQKDNLRYAGSVVWGLTALAAAERELGDTPSARKHLEEAVHRAEPLARSLDVADRRYAERAFLDRAARNEADRCHWLNKAKALWEDRALRNSNWLEERRKATSAAACP